MPSVRTGLVCLTVVVAVALVPGVWPATAQTIYRVAGGGIDDGVPATAANLAFPLGAVADASGNIYIADTYQRRVRKVDSASGLISTVLGNGNSNPGGDGGPAVQASSHEVFSIAIDRSGNLYYGMHFGGVRKIDAKTGIVTTIIGGGSDPGDGVPATRVSIGSGKCFGIALDQQGNLYYSETDTDRVRKLSVSTGLVTTIGGSGEEGFSGEDGPATQARLFNPHGIAVAPNGDVFVADTDNHVVRKISGGIISRVAGTGEAGFSGDFGSPLNARISYPKGVVVDDAGVIYIADHGNNRVRRIADGVIRTVAPVPAAWSVFLNQRGELLVSSPHFHSVQAVDVASGETREVAGTGNYGFEGDNRVATSAGVLYPRSVAMAPDNALYIIDGGRDLIRRIDPRTGIITRVAGGGANRGENVPAIDADLAWPDSMAFDSSGNLFFTEYYYGGCKIKRIDRETARITTMAGTGECGHTPDGAIATTARLANPSGIAISSTGDIYFAENGANRIRRISNGILTTVAGDGTPDSSGDGGPATLAHVNQPRGLAIDSSGSLYVAENSELVRVIDPAQNSIRTLIHNSRAGFFFQPAYVSINERNQLYAAGYNAVWRVFPNGTASAIAGAFDPGIASYGDGGPAALGSLAFARGLSVTNDGTIYVADYDGNAVRAISSCQAVDPSTNLQQQVTGLKATLSWDSAPRAMSYALLVDTVNPPVRVLVDGIDPNRLVATQTYSTTDLQPNTTYHWRVRSKGDRYCLQASQALSAVSSFTTHGCAAPLGPVLTSPAANSVVPAGSMTLQWQAASGAATYDVYLSTGTTGFNLVASTSGTSATVSLVANVQAEWYVVARSSCDAGLIAQSATARFSTSGACAVPAAFALLSPADGVANVALSAILTWQASSAADSYDVYFGQASPPVLYRSGIRATELAVNDLLPTTSYFWRVVARTSCNASVGAQSAISTFSTRTLCLSPQKPVPLFSPPGSVAIGQSYVLIWAPSPDLGFDGTYEVERSSDGGAVETQRVEGAAASFIAFSEGNFSHRVRAVAPCDLSVTSTWSDARVVNVVRAPPNVIFTRQPSAAFGELNQPLEGVGNSFTVENIGSTPTDVLITGRTIDSRNFFELVIPEVQTRLDPGVPRTFSIRYGGPDVTVPGSYLGLIVVNVPNTPVIPYALLNLRIGAQQGTAPEFTDASGTISFAAFEGFAAADPDDADRTPLVVRIKNPGTTPIELAAEVGPEAWLMPDSGWNDLPINPGATREVTLRTRRSQARTGTPFPRYTYFTVRTKDGRSARLLVQDSDVATMQNGRVSPSSRSFILPDVSSTATAMSVLRLTNLGTEPVTTGLVYTPEGKDGFRESLTSTVVVPPNDVVVITDPLRRLFKVPDGRGAIEVVASSERLLFLTVNAITALRRDAESTLGLGPILRRREGARSGQASTLVGVSRSSDLLSSLLLEETSGDGTVSARVTLQDATGAARGATTVSVPRLSQVTIDPQVLGQLGLTEPSTGATLRIESIGGEGSLVSILKLTEVVSGGSVMFVGRLEATSGASKIDAGPIEESSSTRSFAAPVVTSPGEGATGPKPLFGVRCPRNCDFTLDFQGTSVSKNVALHLPAGTTEFKNVLTDALKIVTAASGLLTLTGPTEATVYARYWGGASPNLATVVGLGDLPLISSSSGAVTGGYFGKRPVYLEGISQSIVFGTGASWELYLTEIGGLGGSVSVSLYESTNRQVAIASKTITIGPHQQSKLDLFQALGLDLDERRKDRANMLCVVRLESGQAEVAAVGVMTDQETLSRSMHLFAPLDVPPPSARDLAVRVQTARRRPARR